MKRSAGWVRQLFDRTAGDYDRIERVMALGSGSWYRRRALGRAGLQPGMRVLDIGVGTGLRRGRRRILVGAAGQVTGVDPSAGMIERANVPAGVKLLIGSAEIIPAAAETADFLSMGYALRHIADISAAFSEFLRVLAPGGRICLLEITRPLGRVPRALLKAYMRGVVPFLARHPRRQIPTPRADALLLGHDRGLRSAGGNTRGDSRCGVRRRAALRVDWAYSRNIARANPSFKCRLTPPCCAAGAGAG